MSTAPQDQPETGGTPPHTRVPKSESRKNFEERQGDLVLVKVADAPSRPPCACGCGGTPKGPKSRFIPGHDAKLASAERKAKAAQA